MEFDDGEAPPEVEGIPLAEEVSAEPGRPKAAQAKMSLQTTPQ